MEQGPLGKQPERVIGERFQVVRRLGQGGMGEVYECFDRQLERTVAVKRLLPEVSRASQGAERFVVEAKSIASLNHQNVVHIYDIADDARGKYIVMEYVDGETLAGRLHRAGTLSVPDAIHLMLQIGRALHLAHERGVIHRDIKPANILITSRGVPKLADFGLAQLAREQDLTRTGTAMGTWSYASPEQLTDAKRADRRSDIYSCGAMMYEMVTGDGPRHIRERAIPPALRNTIVKCLAKSPDERFQTVQELLAALSSVYRKAGVAQSPQPAPPAKPRESRPRTIEPVTQESVLWRARRRPWSRPIRTVLGLAILLCVLKFRYEVNTSMQGFLDRIEQDPAAWQAAPVGVQPTQTYDAYRTRVFGFLKGLPYWGVSVVLALLFAVKPVWRCLGTVYRITPARLVIRKGVLLLKEVDCPLDEFEEVRISRGLFGALLQYGDIELTRPRKMPLVLEGVPRPEKTKEAILAQLTRRS
ncbi:MAG TPA: protein kinase [Candidatus Hydrogenedentes bacterium]|nr:protein kinase [Candidatus Hydrogenedentota bacterium]